MARNYGQHCGLAVALDVTSRRWSLLIVRDLAPGPRRFNQLFDGLPGISTDLLTDRLRDLEAAGAVERRTDVELGRVYALTERGTELMTICQDLARWGMPLLPDFASTPLHVEARWALQTMASNAAPIDSPICLHFRLDGADPLTVSLDEDGTSVRYGALGTPDAVVDADARSFFALRAWTRRSGDPLPEGVKVEGSLEALVTAFEHLPLLLDDAPASA